MKCGECTLCCKLLNIPWMESPINSYCSQCEIGVGCKIQETKDKKCKSFDCSYAQMENVHIDLRPDNCKVIFEKISDEVFFGTQDPNFDVTEIAKGQILSFVGQGYSVILSSTKHKDPVVYLSKDHDIKMVNKQVQEYLNNKE